MKKTFLKCVATGLLGLTLAVVASDQATAQVDEPRRVVVETDDDDFDWGWLGLLGLLGLGGLMRRDHGHTTHRDTVAPVGSHTTHT